MLKLPSELYNVELDDSDEVWYGNITDERLRTSLFLNQDWLEDNENCWIILTFKDIEDEFNSWTPEDRAEYLQDDDTPDYTVYDWLCDWMSNLLIVKSINRKEC
jgi:hypothetical protein